MKIAIVDDDSLDRQSAESCLRQQICTRYPEAADALKIECFASGEALLENFLPGSFDLIVLDIYMEGVSGLDTARVIRTRDLEVGIVFLTSSVEHILEGYRVFATGYFIKPLAEHLQEFAETLAYVFAKLLEKRKQVLLQVRGKEIEVPYREILYVDMNEGRQLIFHLSGQDISTYGVYADYQKILLADRRFLECHHRIIINMDQVESMKAENFLLKDGRSSPISRRKKHEAKTAYMRYLIGH